MSAAGRTIVVLAALAAAACSKSSADPRAQRPAPLVAVVRVEARDVPVELKAPVDLRPIEQADVGSKVLGYVDAVFVDRGDKVKKGQVVAVVRPSDLPDQLAAARGAQAQARAAVALAKANADRAHDLSPQGLMSKAEVEQADAALSSADAAKLGADAQTAALAVRLGETKLASPLDGFVLARRLDPGALVGPPGGGAIVTVARTDVLRVFVSIHERDAKGLALGQDAHVDVDAIPDKRFTGKVVRLAPAFDPTTRTLEAEVQLQNPNGELRPGMYGRGAIVVAVHPHAPVIPVAALLVSDRKRYVFVVDGDRARRVAIQTGVDEGDWLEVTEGVKAGDQVVIAGADGLSDGATVRVAAAPDAGAPK